MQVDRVGDVDRFAFAIDQQSRGEATVIQFWLPRRTMVPWGAGEAAPEPWAIAPIDSQRAIDAGGRQVFRDVRVHSALWVLPGPEQDRMAEAGRLLPEDPAAPLPASARRGSITSATREVSLRAGEPGEVTVRVRDLGDQPWLDFDSYRGTGAVRVAARWYALPGEGGEPVRLAHPPVRGDLPVTLWPGEGAEVTVPLDPRDEAGVPFAPGRYRLELVVVQEGRACSRRRRRSPSTCASSDRRWQRVARPARRSLVSSRRPGRLRSASGVSTMREPGAEGRPAEQVAM